MNNIDIFVNQRMQLNLLAVSNAKVANKMPVRPESSITREFQSTFQKFIGQEKLISTNSRILVAVSGGVDSMVMLDLFNQGKYRTGVAHCNFGLRGEESNRDCKFVRDYCAANGIEFHTRKFDTTRVAIDEKVSIQMAARNLRYKWFESIRKRHHYDAIATAHHHDDSVETVFQNLIRGTGLAGLAGIPVKRDFLIRPLLFATRNQILKYAKSSNLSWREDQSNLDNKYERNLLRNKVIPVLYKANRNLEKSLLEYIPKFRLVEELLIEYSQKVEKTLLKKRGGSYWLSMQIGLLPFPEPLLYQMIRKFGFSRNQVREILSTEISAGKRFLSKGFILTIDRTYWIIEKKESNKFKEVFIAKKAKECTTKHGKFIFNIQKPPINITANPNMACLDLDKLRFPLKVRLWRQGDKFQPLGMKGKKKVSDFMIDEKIPVNLKKRIMVVTSGDDIVWIAGYRIDDRYKVTSKTRRIYLAKYLSHD